MICYLSVFNNYDLKEDLGHLFLTSALFGI